MGLHWLITTHGLEERERRKLREQKFGVIFFLAHPARTSKNKKNFF